MPIAPDQLPDEPEALKRIIAAMAQDALAAQAEIARLKFQLERYQRAAFGRSSEKLAREAEQLELAIEGLEEDEAERLAAAPIVAAVIEGAAEAQKPARKEVIPLKPPPPTDPPDEGEGTLAYTYTTEEAIAFFQARVEKNPRDYISFRYLGDVHQVVVFMPPAKGKTPSQALFFREGDVARELDRPLTA